MKVDGGNVEAFVRGLYVGKGGRRMGKILRRKDDRSGERWMDRLQARNKMKMRELGRDE